jgi:hypothetical protein
MFRRIKVAWRSIWARTVGYAGILILEQMFWYGDAMFIA